MPSHPVKWYSSAMPGAPLLRNVAGDLIAVLDWCLVNGSASTAVQSIVVASGVATVTFASAHTFQKHQIIEVGGVTGALTALNDQWRVSGVASLSMTFPAPGVADGTASGTIICKTPALGWQKAFFGTNKAAYRSQDVTGTRLYARIPDAGTTNATVQGYEFMTDVDTGSNLFELSTPVSNVFKSDSSTARKWWLVGDPRSVYGTSNYSGDSGTAYGFGFGDFEDWVPGSNFGFFICGINGFDSIDNSTRYISGARGHTLLPGAVTLTRTGVANSSEYPSVIDGGFVTRAPALLRQSLGGANGVRGYLRGVRDWCASGGPANGQILDADFGGYDGGLAIVMVDSATAQSGNKRIAVDLVGPW